MNSQYDASDISCLGTDRSRHRRGRNININSMDLKSDVSLAFESESYNQFWRRIESPPHNELHVMVGCDMSFVATAAYDPVFYLHHANVDRQFAFWQQLQRLRGSQIDFSDLKSNLPPFHRRNINQYEKTRMNSVGVNTLDYKRNLCYEYDTLTFDGMTPEQF